MCLFSITWFFSKISFSFKISSSQWIHLHSMTGRMNLMSSPPTPLLPPPSMAEVTIFIFGYQFLIVWIEAYKRNLMVLWLKNWVNNTPSVGNIFFNELVLNKYKLCYIYKKKIIKSYKKYKLIIQHSLSKIIYWLYYIPYLYII